MKPYKRPTSGAYTFYTGVESDERVRNAPPRMKREVEVEIKTGGKRIRAGTIQVMRRAGQ